MNALENRFRIVEVLTECRLRDDEGHEQMYWRRDGNCLATGFYVVHWPRVATVGRFNEDAFFEGPFQTRAGAEAGMVRIMELAAGEDAWEAGRRSAEDPITVVDDRLRRHRRTT